MYMKNNRGMTLVEAIVVTALMLVVLLPFMSIYFQSIGTLYTTENLTEAQKQGNNAVYFMSQDLGGAEEFLNISSTRLAVRTYRATTVGFYLSTSDSTLRRISSYSGAGSYSGGEIKARDITKLSFQYYTDTTFVPTLTTSTVDAVRFDVTIQIPASDLTRPNSLMTTGYNIGSFVWCRNKSTL